MNEILNEFVNNQLKIEREAEALVKQQLGLMSSFENYIKENYDIDSMSYSPNRREDDYPQVFINARKSECLKIMYNCDINYMCLRANHENYTLILVLELRP